jgi:hypothetical protein
VSAMPEARSAALVAAKTARDAPAEVVKLITFAISVEVHPDDGRVALVAALPNGRVYHLELPEGIAEGLGRQLIAVGARANGGSVSRGGG